ncbi:hypothetical protein ACSV9I_16735 [Rhizobium sp. G187]
MSVAPMKDLNGGGLAPHSAPHAVAIWRSTPPLQGSQSLQKLEETA